MRRAMAAMALATLVSGCDYNRIVALREQIDAAWAQVENQLQRRNDLIPNLVEVTRGYAAHEKEIFDHVADARAKLMSAGSRDEKIDAAGELGNALGRLLAIAERYPDLKANQHREPDRRRAHALQRGRPRLQLRHQELPDRTLRKRLRL
jgi:LemA protein